MSQESDQNCSNPTPSNKFTHLMIKVYENSSKEESATADEVRKFVFSGPLTDGGDSLQNRTNGKIDQYVDPSLVLNIVPENRNSISEDRDTMPEGSTSTS